MLLRKPVGILAVSLGILTLAGGGTYADDVIQGYDYWQTMQEGTHVVF